ncbi:hypothetical protein BESB_062360 [Besnoitia besnoiti]|uniref:Uncharacterized protein n=1 Tax=Besnoitia besnoiti TaxID=94643 RepID=A0A2A9MBV3_BESBE|nr:hypothetical protein BESB_062360 [Besnoitia besnoiti]PFH35349.1 hypothetical protein BESB_062360 [Besnoitia besnoiti]
MQYVEAAVRIQSAAIQNSSAFQFFARSQWGSRSQRTRSRVLLQVQRPHTVLTSDSATRADEVLVFTLA